jgi:cyclic beta-1,2-glucan synthetase
MYRLVVESLLGLNLEADRLRLTPCMPAHWSKFAVRYRFRETFYDIAVQRVLAQTDEAPDAISVTVDSLPQEGPLVLLVDDRQPHRVAVHLATRSMAPPSGPG